jgi:hypothetical protein
MEELMDETAGAKGVDAVEEAMQAAEKHEARSEKLAALVAEAKARSSRPGRRRRSE